MDAGDLAELQRVHDQADVAVVGEPEAVVLKRRLVAVAAACRSGRRRRGWPAAWPILAKLKDVVVPLWAGTGWR